MAGKHRKKDQEGDPSGESSPGAGWVSVILRIYEDVKKELGLRRALILVGVAAVVGCVYWFAPRENKEGQHTNAPTPGDATVAIGGKAASGKSQMFSDGVAVSSGSGAGSTKVQNATGGSQIVSEGSQGVSAKGIVVIPQLFPSVNSKVEDDSRRLPQPYFDDVNPYKLKPDENRSLKDWQAKNCGDSTESWDCAYVAFLLAINGEPIDPKTRWAGERFVENLMPQLEKQAAVATEQLSKVQRLALPLMLLAEYEYSRQEYEKSIEAFDRYRKIIELTGGEQHEGRIRDSYERATHLCAAACLSVASRSKEAGDQKRAGEFNARALKLMLSLTPVPGAGDGPPLPDLTIFAAANGAPFGWIKRFKSSPAKLTSADVRQEGAFGHLDFDYENGSVQFIKIATVENPASLRLEWFWRLDEAPAGAEENGVSVNHPLNVAIAFEREGTLVVVHYVWDPIQNIGDEWLDPDTDPIIIPPLKFKTEYPHIVVSDAETPKGQWVKLCRDLGEDYGHFHPGEQVPRIRAFIVQSNCQFGDPDQRHVKGSIGGLRLVPKEGAN
jgi:hypothetical protein